MHVTNAQMESLRAELQRIENAVAAAVMVDTPTPTQPPRQPTQVFNVSTPRNSQAQPDPWHQYREGAHATAPPPNNPGSPGSFGPDAHDPARAQQYPGVPSGWTQDPNSIFTPSSRNGAPGAPQPAQSQFAPNNGTPFQRNPYEGSRTQFMGDQDALARKSESVRKFSGHAVDVVNWAKHMVDHMA